MGGRASFGRKVRLERGETGHSIGVLSLVEDLLESLVQ